MKYNPQKIEKKWQKRWEEDGTFKDYSRKEKFYALDMFPYPSGAGLHVGHPKGYIATDVVARFEQLRGKSVLHPMGWDAFGLPAENYALKNKVHPRISTEENIKTFKEQLGKIGFTYDWDREINTTDPEYYKWTQWIFTKLFEKGLAYESNEPINWCPSCKTGLANEDLEDGKCERCGSEVEQKPMRQWVLKMTEYADRLLEDLDNEDLDWEKQIKEQQRNWIGRSSGVKIKFSLRSSQTVAEETRNDAEVLRGSASDQRNSATSVEVFTTRVDTIFGCTYVVLAPEHKEISNLKSQISNWDKVKRYVEQAKKKTNLERTELAKEKTGVKLEGVEAVNPFNGESVPIFVADYVLGSYGTGAVMAVPAHDERDYAFAKKYGLPIKQSVAPYIELKDVDAPKSDKDIHKFHAVTAIIKHWSEEKYLFVKFVNGVWGLIGGSVEESDNHYDDAILREAEEETVFKNFEIKDKIFNWAYSRGYKTRKAREEECQEPVYILQLLGDKRSDEIAEEEGIKEWAWLSPKEVSSKTLLTHHRFYFEHYLKKNQSFADDGILVDSGEFTGLSSEDAREKMAEWLEKTGNGKRQVNYKMRDWVFSRQRYWGEPIPLIFCEHCKKSAQTNADETQADAEKMQNAGWIPVPDEELPVRLPEVESYEPTGTGESPLAGITEWVNAKCPKCGGPGKRETNTMPQWAGSSWYYLRYINPKNTKELVEKKKEEKWMPVDLYVGGAEHATRHLLYARFWHKFLYDIGVVSTKEPFKRLVHVGLINAEDGRKMSKRWNNVINPDDVIAEFGADSLRLYEMFMGPFTQNIAWSTEGVSGVRRFLDKVWTLSTRTVADPVKSRGRDHGARSTQKNADRDMERLLHKTIKKVTEDIENFRFNTAISALMILVNTMEKQEVIRITDYRLLITLLSVFAPHIAEELWSQLGNKKSIFLEKWPVWNEKLIQDETITLIVQVNGKVRDKVEVSVDISEEDAREKAFASERVQKFIDGKEVRKIIFVKGKLINVVY